MNRTALEPARFVSQCPTETANAHAPPIPRPVL